MWADRDGRSGKRAVAAWRQEEEGDAEVQFKETRLAGGAVVRRRGSDRPGLRERPDEEAPGMPERAPKRSSPSKVMTRMKEE